MWKRIRRILIIVFAAVFLFCGGTVAVVQHQYNVSRRLYRAASSQYTSAAPAIVQENAEKPVWVDDGIERLPETAPIQVDFDALLEACPDVVGWIYCEDTVIDYPVVQGKDNDFYLHHSYNGEFNTSGTLFVDYRNFRDFQDPSSIIYGHHMANGSMFAGLSMWQLRSYYEEHPVMWLLTPTQDYKVEIFSSYDISAYSNTYAFFHEYGEGFTQYLYDMADRAAFRNDVELDPNGRYVLLSTCAYRFADARSVVHGRLRPVMSIAGQPIGPLAE